MSTDRLTFRDILRDTSMVPPSSNEQDVFGLEGCSVDVMGTYHEMGVVAFQRRLDDIFATIACPRIGLDADDGQLKVWGYRLKAKTVK